MRGLTKQLLNVFTGDKVANVFCAYPLIRPSLTRRPPSPAKGEGRAGAKDKGLALAHQQWQSDDEDDACGDESAGCGVDAKDRRNSATEIMSP
jgi:hypothetical protein